MPSYAYHRPTTLAAALALLEADPTARPMAGGTDLLVQQDQGRVPSGAIVSLRAIPELSAVAFDDAGGVRIGAAVPVGDLLRHADLMARYPALHAALHLFASPQIRNVATLGGNLCNASPAADSAPALLVHDARLEIAGPAARRELALQAFFEGPGQTCLAPGEMVSAILLPAVPKKTRSTFVRRGRVQMDLAIVSVAVSLRLDGPRCSSARVAVGAVAPTPLRLDSVEALLQTAPLDQALLDRARALLAKSIAPITDLRAGADYRRVLCAALFARALRDLLPALRESEAA